MRRLIVAAAVLAMIAVACGDDGGDTGEATTAAGSSATETTAASGQPSGSSGDPVEVTILGTIKGEIGEQFEAAMAAYNDSQDAYTLVSIPMEGANPVEKMTTLYASGNATTMAVMGQEFTQFQDNLLDLSDADFSQHALPGTQDLVTIDGKVYGMPVTVEAFGLLYNTAVLDAATGGFDPASISTRDELVSLLDSVAAYDGADAFHLSPMDWSLGAHLTNVMFSPQADDPAARRAFLDDLKAGSVTLIDNPVFNGWMDTIDVLIERNVNAASPLAADYDDGTLALGTGEVGLWFMGNWAFPQLRELGSTVDFGILPVPISNDPGTYGNTEISVGVPFYIVVDEAQSSPEERAGAIDFLNWLVADPVGQDYYVNQFNFIPVFDTFDIRPQDPLSNQILEYVEAGKTLEWMNALYPPDGWPTMGASMQEYLVGRLTRAELATAFESYWAGVDS